MWFSLFVSYTRQVAGNDKYPKAAYDTQRDVWVAIALVTIIMAISSNAPNSTNKECARIHSHDR